MAPSCKYTLLLLSTCLLSVITDTRPEFRIVSGCTCTGYRLDFQCTAVGPGATIWRGNAFVNCPSSSNEILLFHSRFATRTAAGSCSNGNIRAHALDNAGQEGHYRSQLNIINLPPEMNGTTVECLYDNGISIRLINSTTITITTEKLPPPMNISLTAVSKGQLHFSWNPVAPTCAAVHYNISAHNCGKCPNTTTSTSVTCTDVVVEDEELCNFGVSTVVCSDVVGAQKEIAVMLSVPNISSSLTSNIDVVPTYMHDTNHDNLMKLTTEFKPSENFWIRPIGIQDMIQLNNSVRINYTDSKNGKTCGNGTLSAELCTNGVCRHEFEIESSPCPPTDFIIKVFGTNDLGVGEISKPIRRDHINNYVKVTRYPSRKMISCEFLHRSMNHYNGKLSSCNITYFDESCQTELLAINASASTATAGYVQLSYRNLPNNYTRYCYIIAASNGTLRVNINGSFAPEPDTTDDVYAPSETIILVSTFLPVIIVMGVVVIGTLSLPYMYVCNCNWWRPKKKRN